MKTSLFSKSCVTNQGDSKNNHGHFWQGCGETGTSRTASIVEINPTETADVKREVEDQRDASGSCPSIPHMGTASKDWLQPGERLRAWRCRYDISHSGKPDKATTKFCQKTQNNKSVVTLSQ